MSQIDELLAKHCPEGVEFRPLAEITSKSASIKWISAADASFKYIDLSSVDRITRQIGDTVSVTAADAPSRARQIVRTGDVIFATTRPTQMRWAVIPEEYDGQIASTGYCVLRPDNDVILTNFLAHILGTGTFSRYVEANQIEGNYPSIPDSRVREFEVPVPPLAVQREIVRILDTFSKMEAELEAELEARKQQYEHFLRAIVLPAEETEWTTLGEATFNHDRMRKPVTRSDRQNGKFPYYGANGVQDYVHDFIFDGTFLLVGEDGSVKNIDGSPVLNWASGKIWVNNHAHVLTAADEQFNLRYLYYYLATVDVTKYVTGGTQPKINQKNLNAIPVPVVPRDYQDKVVEFLDQFDALINDLSVGLPAELTARRQQYEHYRDKLLTFKELEPAS